MALYVMGYTAGRGWIEALRNDHANHILGLRLNNWTAIIVFLGRAGLVPAARRVPRRTRDARRTPAARTRTAPTTPTDERAGRDARRRRVEPASMPTS